MRKQFLIFMSIFLLLLLSMNLTSSLLTDVINITDSGAYIGVEYQDNDTYLFDASTWFYVNITNASNKNMYLNVTGSWINKSLFYTCDSSSWAAIPRSNLTWFNSSPRTMEIKYNFGTCDNLSLSRYFPYTYTDTTNYYNSLSADYITKEIMWTSPQSKNMYLIKITNESISSDNKKVIFIVTRQHPSESSTSFVTKGIIDKLINATDEESEKFRKRYIWYIIPMANPDGIYYGESQFNYLGQDLNDCWDNSIYTSGCSETTAMKTKILDINSLYGIDLFIDSHGSNLVVGGILRVNESISSGVSDTYFLRSARATKIKNNSLIYGAYISPASSNEMHKASVWNAYNTSAISITFETGNDNISAFEDFYVSNGVLLTKFIAEVVGPPIFKTKLNENQGTIAYDVSGNGNNGTITGASWNNDGIRVALTNLVDYSWTTAGVLTLLNIDQIYTQFVFTTAYDYDGTNYYGLGENWFVSFFEDFAGWIAVIVLVVAAGIVLTIVVKEFTGKQESI